MVTKLSHRETHPHLARNSGPHPARNSSPKPARNSGRNPARNSGRNPARNSSPHPAHDSGPHPDSRESGLRLGRLAAVLGVLTCALLSFAGAVPAAFAAQIPVPGAGGAYGPVPASAATFTRVITTGGTPAWQIALIALGAALLAAAAAVSLDRTLGRRGPVSVITA